MQVEDKKILIDLSQDIDTQAVKPENLIHQEAKRDFLASVRSTFERIEGFKKELGRDADDHCWKRYHDVMTIHGTRGSGKTTFLLSMLQYVSSPETYLQDEQNFPRGIINLGLIDPTLLGSRENLLYTIIDRIKGRVKRFVEHQHGGYNNDERCNKQERWHNQLFKLAQGLKSIGEGERERKEFDWDAQLLMQESLDRVSHGGDLEREFHRFVNLSLDIMGERAFILGLDDIDTRFDYGWDVLEVLRKYLTTPQLIVALSGDLELYALLVEREQLRMFGLDFTKKPGIKEQEILRKIKILTEQYIQKTLNPKHRISIYNINEYLTIKQYEILIYDSTTGHLSKNIKLILREMFQKILVTNEIGQLEFYMQTILNFPFRNILRTLEEIVKYTGTNWKLSSEIEKLPSSDHKRPLIPNLPDPVSLLLGALNRVFMEQFKTIGFNQDELFETNFVKIIQTFMACLTKANILNHGFRFIPNFNDNWINIAIMLTGAKITQLMCKIPQNVFEYAFRTCLAIEIINMRNVNYKTVYNFLRLFEQSIMSPILIARRSIGIIYETLPNKESTSSYFGSMQVCSPYEFSQNAFKNLYFQYTNPDEQYYAEPLLSEFTNKLQAETMTNNDGHYLINSFETAKNSITSWHSRLIPMLFSSLSHNKKESYFVSFFNILGIISAILNPEITLNNIKELLARLSQVLMSFPLYGNTEQNQKYFFKNQEVKDDEEINEYLETSLNVYEGEIDFDDYFINEIINWKQFWATETLKVNPNLVAKAFTRFFYSLRSIDSNLGVQFKYIGNFLHRCIIAFFNSILIEECASLPEEKRIVLNKNNSIDSDLFFLRNLDKLGLTNSEDLSSQFIIDKPTLDNYPLKNGAITYTTSANLPKFDRYLDFSFFSMIFSFPAWSFFLQPPNKNDASLFNNIFNIQLLFSIDYIFKENNSISNIESKQKIISECINQFSARLNMTAVEFSGIKFVNLFYILNSIASPQKAYKTVRYLPLYAGIKIDNLPNPYLTKDGTYINLPPTNIKQRFILLYDLFTAKKSYFYELAKNHNVLDFDGTDQDVAIFNKIIMPLLFHIYNRKVSIKIRTKSSSDLIRIFKETVLDNTN